MSRLTKRNADGVVTLAKGCHDGCEYLTCSMEEGYSCEHQCEADIVCKLADYEDKQEQGLLIELPCKVGDKAWYVHRTGIDEVEVDSFVFNVNLFVNASLYISGERFGMTLTPYKTLFFTRSEAESALAKMGGNE